MSRQMRTMGEGSTKDGSIAEERLDFLMNKRCRIRLWWSEEGRTASPGGDLFDGILVGVIPVGRDYYFVFLSGPEENQKRSIIKTAAVLEISEQ